MYVRVMVEYRIEICADNPTREKIISAVIAEVDVMLDDATNLQESFFQTARQRPFQEAFDYLWRVPFFSHSYISAFECRSIPAPLEQFLVSEHESFFGRGYNGILPPWNLSLGVKDSYGSHDNHIFIDHIQRRVDCPE